MATLEYSFITYLEGLKKAENRAALAALRRGLGQPPGSVPEMFPYVVRFLPKKAYPNSWTEQSYYLIAALYALHPESIGKGNLGTHFARTLDPNPDLNAAVERRFITLLTAHPDDLAAYLRQAISFLKSRQKPVVINWHQLMGDVLAWGYPEGQNRVQKQWAAQFWKWRDDEEKEPETAAARE